MADFTFLIDDYTGDDALAASEYVRSLPDLQALDTDDVRALAALAVAVDVPGAWCGDNAPAHALRDRIEGCILDNCAQYVADAEWLRTELRLTMQADAAQLHALSVQFLPVAAPDDIDADTLRADLRAAIIARAADMRIPANIVGA